MRVPVLFTAAVAATLISSPAAQATIRITGDPGGLIAEYTQRFLQARASGEPVVIDGACLSACTLAIAMLPRQQVCMTPRAVLGFHAAWRPTPDGGKATSSMATQAMWDLYPADVRGWITRHGGLTPRMIFLRGRELAAMVPSCGGGPVLTRVSRRPAGGGREGDFAAIRPGQPRARFAVHRLQ